jgi:hypothetical protein
MLSIASNIKHDQGMIKQSLSQLETQSFSNMYTYFNPTFHPALFMDPQSNSVLYCIKTYQVIPTFKIVVSGIVFMFVFIM